MKQLRGSLLLVLTAMIWGAAFVAQSVGMDYIGPFTFLCSRSFLGSAVLLPVIFFRSRHQQENADSPAPAGGKLLLLGGLLCGIALFLGSIFQQIGIQHTTAGKAGFITTLYVVLVPLVGLFAHKRVAPKVWGAVVLSLVGMYFLCLFGTDLSSINRGDLWEIAGSLGFTLHILVIDHFSSRVDGVKMSCIQFFVCGVLAMVFMFALEAPSWSSILAAALPICYAGILSSGAGYTLQIIAQKDTDPTVASLLMSLESVFSLVFGWILLKEAMSGVELLGCLLIFVAVIWVQLPSRQKAA